MSADNIEEKNANNLSSNKEEKPPANDNNQAESELSLGLTLSSGEINWDCPCLDGMPSGPCGSEFKEVFMCMFNNNTNDEKYNLNCLTSFNNFFKCMSEYPDYSREKGYSDDLLGMIKEPEIKSAKKQDDKTEFNELHLINTKEEPKTESTKNNKTECKE